MTLGQFLAAPIHSRDEVYRPPAGGGAPPTPGTYACWARNLPDTVDTSGCLHRDNYALIYAGESGNLRGRVQQHYRINSDGSGLRIRLSIALGLELRLINSASGYRPRWSFLKTFGEAALTGWLKDNMRVSWLPNANRLALKQAIIAATSPPLNEPFTPTLRNLIDQAYERARKHGPIPDC